MKCIIELLKVKNLKIIIFRLLKMIEIPSRMRKLALLSGATCTIIGGVVIWKDSIAGQKVEQIKTEKQLIKDVQERHFIGYLC